MYWSLYVCFLFLSNPPQHSTVWTSSAPLHNNSNPAVVELSNNTVSQYRGSIRIGVIVEAKRYKDFQKAIPLLNLIDNKNVSIISRVVDNNLYNVLRTVCDNFTGSRVQGMVFVCEGPCSKVTSFISFIGLAGVVVEKRSEDHSVIFMDEPKAFLDIKPTLHQQNIALIELITQFQWKSICLIYDTHPHTLHLVQDLEHRINKHTVEINRKIQVDGNNITIDTGLRTAYGKTRVFVLYCSRRNAEIVLERAKMQRMTDTEHAWIVGEMVLENRGKIPAAFPIGLLGIEYNHKEEHVGHIVDAIRVVLSGIYQLVHNKTWMAAPTGNCDNDTNITPQVLPLYGAMKKVSVVGQTGRISFTEDGYRKASRYNFINLQQNRNTRELFWQNVGYLESGHVTLEQIVWPGGVVRTPSGVPRVRLRVVMYEVAPLLYVRDFKSSLKGCQRGRDCTLVTKDKMELRRCCYGLCIDLLSLLSRDLDLDPEIRVIEGGRAGSITNGRWTGLIGSVLYGQTDMAISSISITEERSKVIDFSEPFLHTGSTILVAKRHGSFKGDGFLKPFEIQAWILLFGVLYLVSFVIFLFESKNPGLQRTRHKDYAGKFDIHISIWLIYSRLFSGNLDAHVPRFVSSRVVLSSWSFSSLMVIALYTANLAAFMVQKEEAHYIDGINDSKIQNPSNSLKFTTILGTSVGKYFKTNFPHIYKFMEKQHKINHSSQGVKALREGKIDAFIWETITLERYTANDNGCRLVTVGKHFDQNGFAAVFPKNSPWTEKVSKMILKYQTSNRNRELARKWQKGYCHQKALNYGGFFTIARLGYNNLMGVFYLLLVGIGLSILVLIGENIVFAINTRKQRNSKSSTQPTMSAEDKLQLQKEVAEVKDILNVSDMANNEVLSKLEQELLQTLQELYELQTPSDKWLQRSTIHTNEAHDTREISHDAIGSLTLWDIKEIIATMKSENRILSEKESVV